MIELREHVEMETEKTAPRMCGLFCLQIASKYSAQALLCQTAEFLLTIVAAAPTATPQEFGEFFFPLWIRQDGFDLAEPGVGNRITHGQFVNQPGHYVKFKEPGPAETPGVLPCAITKNRLNQEVALPFPWDVDLTTTPWLDAFERLMELLDLCTTISFRGRKTASPVIPDHIDLLEDGLKDLCVRSLLSRFRQKVASHPAALDRMLQCNLAT